MQQFVCWDSSLPSSSQSHIWSNMSSAAANVSKKQNPRRAEAAFDPKSWADLLYSSGKLTGHLEKGQKDITYCESLLSLEVMKQNVLNVIHRHWNMLGFFQGKFQFDKTSCGTVRPAYWITPEIENEALHSCPSQHILNSSLISWKKSFHFWEIPSFSLSHQTNAFPW